MRQVPLRSARSTDRAHKPPEALYQNECCMLPSFGIQAQLSTLKEVWKDTYPKLLISAKQFQFVWSAMQQEKNF